MEGIFTTAESVLWQVAKSASLNSTYNGGTGSIGVFTGTDNEDKIAPCVICWAESATEDYPFSGIWHVKSNIIVKEMAKDSAPSTVDTLLGDIQSAFLTQSIENTLNSKSPHFYVYQVLFDSNNSTTDGDAWVHTLGLDIVCTTK